MKRLVISIVLILSSIAVLAQNKDLTVKITYYSPEIVRVEKFSCEPRKTPSVSVIMEPAASVASPKVRVKADKDGLLTFTDSKGRKLLAESYSTSSLIVDGPDSSFYKVSQGWSLGKDEPIYGLGMLQNGKMDQRGENRLMVQSNLEDFTNFFQSVKGYGVFWDNYSPTTISDDGTVLGFESEVAESIDYYFIFGGDADGVISDLRQLTGKVPMLPLWTYGYHQSRERYKTQEEMLNVVRGYRAAGVPLDGIIQDWQYWGNNYLWNAMEFLSPDFQHPQEMVDEVHNSGAHMSISIWQSFGPQTKPYRQLDEKGLLLDFITWPLSGLAEYWPPRMDYPSGVKCYDAYSEEARDIYWDNLRRLYDFGIDAWWMDSTDPDHTERPGDFDQKTAMGSFRSVRNIYPLMCVEGVYDHQRAVSSDKRVFILTRSFFMGQQRTGANTWSGDTQSTWEAFRAQIPLCLNYTMTGNPNCNSDIGGFFPSGYNKPGETQTCSRNPLFQELYVRWLQFGLFNPMMRSHGESSRREIWEFGKKGEPVYDAIEKAIRMRYALLPYIYSTAWQVSSNDDSFMRALVMDFAKDKNVWDINDEFMFGRSLLVAPVTHAIFTDEGRRWSEDTPDWTKPASIDVYLPAGAKWYEVSTGKKYNGGTVVQCDASLDKCPVFAREGAIFPVAPVMQYSSESKWDELEIRVYGGADGSFTLYEDEGDNYNYENGAFATVDFTLKGTKLTIGERKGSFPGMLQERTFKVVFYDGRQVCEKDVTYSGNKLILDLGR
ncbi:MAG: glycoside hydrolase family 31 protein [Bacteroidales bacterium]|nr:glycoside hydrolase family 31 protein [Bacteroidales bacterium]